MKGIIHERAARRGEQTDASAPPIYPSDVDKMVAALSKEGSMHSAVVKFVLSNVLLTSHDHTHRRSALRTAISLSVGHE